jgi:hypothetical protein
MLLLLLTIYFCISRAYIHIYIYYSSSTALVALLTCVRYRDLLWGPSRDSNSGLPYSKPTRYCLSYAAPFKKSYFILSVSGPLH